MYHYYNTRGSYTQGAFQDSISRQALPGNFIGVEEVGFHTEVCFISLFLTRWIKDMDGLKMNSIMICQAGDLNPEIPETISADAEHRKTMMKI